MAWQSATAEKSPNLGSRHLRGVKTPWSMVLSPQVRTLQSEGRGPFRRCKITRVGTETKGRDSHRRRITSIETLWTLRGKTEDGEVIDNCQQTS